jgi:hypothetical protein
MMRKPTSIKEGQLIIIRKPRKQSQNRIGFTNLMERKNGFLPQLVERFAEHSAGYLNFMSSHRKTEMGRSNLKPLFDYREKQLHTCLAPSLSSITKDAYLYERPITRKDKKKGQRIGRVDYWCQYKQIDYFIETQFARISSNSKIESDRILLAKRWTGAQKQLDSIKRDLENRIKSKGFRGSQLLQLLIVPILYCQQGKRKL